MKKDNFFEGKKERKKNYLTMINGQKNEEFLCKKKLTKMNHS